MNIKVPGLVSESSLLVILIFLMTISVMGADMYIPSLPHIESYFNTSHVNAKLTFSIFIIGFAMAQLFYGPLSDAYGRKPVLLVGVSIGFVGSILCIFAPSIHGLIFGRLVQGIGIGVGSCMARSIAQDKFSGPKVGHVISYLSLISGLAPAIAPVMGGYLQAYLGWQSVFVFIAAYLLMILLVIFRWLPETNLKLDKQAIQINQVIRNYKTLLISPVFMGNVTSGSCAIAGIFVYYTMSPFLLQKTLHLSVVTYGWLAVFISAAVILGRLFNVYLVKCYPAKTVTGIGNFVLFFGGLFMVLSSFIALNVIMVIIPMMLFVLGTGLVFSSSAAAAFSPFKAIAGCTSALYTCLQTLGAFIASLFAVHLQTHNQFALGAILTILGLVAIFGYRLANSQTHRSDSLKAESKLTEI